MIIRNKAVELQSELDNIHNEIRKLDNKMIIYLQRRINKVIVLKKDQFIKIKEISIINKYVTITMYKVQSPMFGPARTSSIEISFEDLTALKELFQSQNTHLPKYERGITTISLNNCKIFGDLEEEEIDLYIESMC